MVNSGWYDPGAVPLVVASAFAFGGTAQFFAGLLEFPRGNTFGFVAFCSYGAFWWSYALFATFFAANVPADFVGWWLVMWGVFTFYMWLATLRANRVIQLVFLGACITFVLLGVGDWTGMAVLHKLGGYVGLVTAALALYLSAAEIINETRGKTVLPIGPYRDVLSDAPGARTEKAVAERCPGSPSLPPLQGDPSRQSV